MYEPCDVQPMIGHQSRAAGFLSRCSRPGRPGGASRWLRYAACWDWDWKWYSKWNDVETRFVAAMTRSFPEAPPRSRMGLWAVWVVDGKFLFELPLWDTVCRCGDRQGLIGFAEPECGWKSGEKVQSDHAHNNGDIYPRGAMILDCCCHVSVDSGRICNMLRTQSKTRTPSARSIA